MINSGHLDDQEKTECHPELLKPGKITTQRVFRLVDAIDLCSSLCFIAGASGPLQLGIKESEAGRSVLFLTRLKM